MPESVEVAVVGAGQAGLSLSYELTRAGIEHVVLERARVGESWRRRWDSFCLVTPNWSMQLPGGHYDGDDPDGFMSRGEIVDHFVRYAQRFRPPVREGVDVLALDGRDGGGLRLRTTSGDVRASQVVVASGAFQKPHRPRYDGSFPAGLQVIDAADYTNPAALPPGKVLVVGSGQTGCQFAEELSEAGRDVFVACGRVPWIPRRIGDADFVEWLVRTSFLETRLADLPSPLARLGGNVQSTGRAGGHDLHYRTLHARGVTLLGHLVGVADGTARFAADLGESVAFGDARYDDICTLVRKTCIEQGLDVPELPAPQPFTADEIEQLDLRGFGAVLFTTGYRPDYRRWIGFPDAFDDMGFPVQVTARASPSPGCTSWASISSGSGSRPACSAWPRMPPCSPNASWPTRDAEHGPVRPRSAGGTADPGRRHLPHGEPEPPVQMTKSGLERVVERTRSSRGAAPRRVDTNPQVRAEAPDEPGMWVTPNRIGRADSHPRQYGAVGDTPPDLRFCEIGRRLVRLDPGPSGLTCERDVSAAARMRLGAMMDLFSAHADERASNRPNPTAPDRHLGAMPTSICRA